MIADMQPTRDEREAKTRELPRPTPPPLPDGWCEEAGMYVSREGDALDPEMLEDSHALVGLLTYLRRMTALVEWAQQRQALAALLARRAGGQS